MHCTSCLWFSQRCFAVHRVFGSARDVSLYIVSLVHRDVSSTVPRVFGSARDVFLHIVSLVRPEPEMFSCT